MSSGNVFEPVKTTQEFAKEEEKILKFWKEKKVFEKSRKKNKGKELFRWLEGPPTANGQPHMGHVLTRSIKDVFLRYKTMKGYDVQPRIAGWDTHGLPVEREVEKALGIKDKNEIEKYGIKEFNQKCKESVFKYEKAWRDMSNRIGFWLDMDHPYITLDENYIESVWWSLKEIWKKGLIYLGHKVVPYCTRCGTPLSTHEAGQGMKETTDPAIFVKFKAKDFEETYFLAWTTTPWTLISNVCLTVHPEIDYVWIEYNGEKLILAEERAKILLKEEYKVLMKFKGKELEKKKYEQLFPYIKTKKKAFYVTLADYVTTTEGTGIVHSAPAFGEDDAETGRKYKLPVLNPVLEDGTFDERITDFKGLHVKKADPKIIEQLKERGLLWKKEKYKHTYPFCPRCDSPLLYYSTPTWYIEMTKMKEKLIENNKKIFWKPEYLKNGRFGNFIENVRDWALSRNRYWGTALPIWICKNGHRTFVGSKEELRKLYGKEFEKDFNLHRPWVDEIKFKCPECEEEAERVPYVIDCWYDSGSAPFAQYHYPFENKKKFKEHFPFDFITEAIDQTRGWFYSLLAISSLLFNTSAYKSVLTMGLILDETGRKLSKRLGNYIAPEEIINVHGADAIRWYLYSSPTWSDARFSDRLVQESLRKFVLTLWNSYSFFVSNANVDNFSPSKFDVPFSERPELDRWLLSELEYLVEAVNKHMDDLSVHLAVKAFESFVDNFSNWYLRQSRRRFWKEELDKDKKSAYSTTYEVLVTLVKLLAPFIPFLTERMYQNLVLRVDSSAPESVHLCDFPAFKKEYVNEQLSSEMDIVLKIVTAGRSLRSSANIKMRQPLSELIVVTPHEKDPILTKYEKVILEELNVKQLTVKTGSEDLISYTLKPNFKVLAKKVKGIISKIKQYLESLDSSVARDYVEKFSSGENVTITVDGVDYVLTPDDIIYQIKVSEGFEGLEVGSYQILLNTELTDELKREGYVRDVVRRIQTMRKDMNLEYTQKIKLTIATDDFGKGSITKFKGYIMEETLATELVFGTAKSEFVKDWEFDNHKITIGIDKV